MQMSIIFLKASYQLLANEAKNALNWGKGHERAVSANKA